jgi:hypothetical protein
MELALTLTFGAGRFHSSRILALRELRRGLTVLFYLKPSPPCLMPIDDDDGADGALQPGWILVRS